MARKKKDVYDYKKRQKLRKEHLIDREISLKELLDICNNDTSATIETEWYYEDYEINLVWFEDETDEQMRDRIANYEAVLEHEKNKLRAQKKTKEEFERKEYLRLKKKFEK